MQTIESREAGAGSDGAIQVSQLNMVDLAGSERARLTGASGERFKEGRHINLSLSTLALVIKQLSESQDYVNFRNSKLTRLLQTSLGGNAMTVMICAVTPAALDETQCTLSLVFFLLFTLGLWPVTPLSYACGAHTDYLIHKHMGPIVLTPVPNGDFFVRCFCEQEYSREVIVFFQEKIRA